MSERIGNYVIERITGGIGIWHGQNTGLKDAVRIVVTWDEARAWCERKAS